MLAHELFAKALRSLRTCVLVNINLCVELVLLLELYITFDERFKVTVVLCVIPDFNLISY